MREVSMFVVFVFCAAIVKAQSTTQNEYLYMKKGYRQVEESGLDVKKGYFIIQLDNKSFGDVTINAVQLKRADSSIAGIILKTSSSADFGSGVNYYCFPAVGLNNADSYGWSEFYSDIELMTGGQKTAVLKWLSYRFQIHQKNKIVQSTKSKLKTLLPGWGAKCN